MKEVKYVVVVLESYIEEFAPAKVYEFATEEGAREFLRRGGDFEGNPVTTFKVEG